MKNDESSPNESKTGRRDGATGLVPSYLMSLRGMMHPVIGDGASTMANRSYLFAADALPASGKPEYVVRRQIGIAEWNYDIPNVFRLLVSAETQKCHSSIWDNNEKIAIAGNFQEGKARLFASLNRIMTAELKPLRDKAMEFLSVQENQRRFFILESGEIFDMNEPPSEEQNEKLFQEILQLARQSDTVAEKSELQPKPRSLLGRLFARPETKAKSSPLDINSLGLGNWSNELYYSCKEED